MFYPHLRTCMLTDLERGERKERETNKDRLPSIHALTRD